MENNELPLHRGWLSLQRGVRQGRLVCGIACLPQRGCGTVQSTQCKSPDRGECM